MVNLDANSPCADLLPLTIGEVSFTETILPEAQVWSISPSPVASGKSKITKASTTLWIGRDHALQVGGTPPKNGAITDQSDAWACVNVSGTGTCNVLARLCPVDLRKMQIGDVVRTLINHLTAIITANSDGFEIYVFRAFARTLIHELQDAANAVKGRNQIGL